MKYIKTLDGFTLKDAEARADIEVLKNKTAIVDTELSATSTNPVQNKVIYNAINAKVDFATGKADRVVITDTNGDIAVSDNISTVELGYLNGVTSNIQSQLNGKVDNADLANYVPKTRTVNGKALSSDITLNATDVGALPSTTPIPTVNNGTLTIQKNGTTIKTFTANSSSNVTANIVVPTKTSDLTNDSKFADTTYVDNKVAGIVDTAPEALNTLNELAAALGDDPNFATTVANQIGQKADKTNTITAGNGLTNGGQIGDNPTLHVGAGNGITVSANAVAAKAGNGITVDANGINHADTSSQTSVTANGRKYITGVTLDDYGHVTGLTTGTETVTDTNTTYDLSAPASKTNGKVTIDLKASGSGSGGTDSVTITGTGSTTVTTDANGTITVNTPTLPKLTDADVINALGYTPADDANALLLVQNLQNGTFVVGEATKAGSVAWTGVSGKPFTNVDTALSSTSTNPVQNKAINTALSGKANTSGTYNNLTVGNATNAANVAIMELLDQDIEQPIAMTYGPGRVDGNAYPIYYDSNFTYNKHRNTLKLNGLTYSYDVTTDTITFQ